MMRLTEVMKCWHEISGENRVLKSQLSNLNMKMGENPQAKAVISALVNGFGGTGGLNSLMQGLGSNSAQGSTSAQTQELHSPNSFAADALRAVLGTDIDISQVDEEFNPMDFLGIGSSSIFATVQHSSGVGAHNPSAHMLQSV